MFDFGVALGSVEVERRVPVTAAFSHLLNIESRHLSGDRRVNVELQTRVNIDADALYRAPGFGSDRVQGCLQLAAQLLQLRGHASLSNFAERRQRGSQANGVTPVGAGRRTRTGIAMTSGLCAKSLVASLFLEIADDDGSENVGGFVGDAVLSLHFAVCAASIFVWGRL